MQKRIAYCLALAFALVCWQGLLLGQPTEDEVKQAAAKGVTWLAANQYPDGSWGLNEPLAVTGLAVKKLMHHAVDPKWGLGLPSPFDPTYAYRTNVINGLNYLLQSASTIPISVQLAGNPDSDGDGIGVCIGCGAWHSTYTNGIALMTLCEAVELDRTVAVGPLTGWTLEQVARDMMDYLAFGQNDGGMERGGWGYYENYAGWSDNSNSGYATLGLGFAGAAKPAGCGFEVPQFVKSELSIWIDHIQNDVNGDSDDGGSGYADPNNWVNVLKTGNLLQQMSLFGDTKDTPRVKDALAYLERHWNDPNQDPGWRGGCDVFSCNSNYQAVFTITKGLVPLQIEEFGGPPPIKWATDFQTVLLAEQYPDGHWEGDTWDASPPVLSTVWALLALQRAVPPPPVIRVPVDIHPTSCRNPINVGSQGVVPIAILGTKTFDVKQIDPATITVEGVPILRWAYEDVSTPYADWMKISPPPAPAPNPYACTTAGPDGYLDLSIKVDATVLAAALAPPPTDGEVRVLTVKGQLKPEFGAKAFAGYDVVVLLKKK